MRPKLLIVGVIFLMALIIAKIIVSGIYLHFDGAKFPVMNIAMAQEGNSKQTSADKTDSKETASKLTDAAMNEKMTALTQKEQELKAREEALQKKEQELAPLQTEVNARIEQLNELQVKLTAMAKDIAEKEQGVKDEKINHLVTLYSSMDAAKAANIMDKLDMDIVVRILANMKGKNAGQIMAAMNADKGARISESLSKME